MCIRDRSSSNIQPPPCRLPRQVFLYQHERVRVARGASLRSSPSPVMRHSHRSSFRHRSTMGLIAFALLLLGARLYGGTYSQNFNAATVGSWILGDGSSVASSA